MFRILIGSIFGGVVQSIIGFLFWGTPLSYLAYKTTGEAQYAAVQTILAQTLTASGSGTYYVPRPDTAQLAVLHGRGPVAMIFFNTHGFPQTSSTALIGGLLLSILSMLLLGLALHAVAGRVTDFASRARIVIFAALAFIGYAILGEPMSNPFMPWGYWIYLAVSLVVGFIAGGLVLARWFVPFADPNTTPTRSR